MQDLLILEHQGYRQAVGEDASPDLLQDLKRGAQARAQASDQDVGIEAESGAGAQLRI